MKHQMYALLLSSIIIIVCVCVIKNTSARKQQMLHQDLENNEINILSLSQEYQGLYIDRSNTAFAQITSLFSIKMISADLRDSVSFVFSFESDHPEKTIVLVYSKDNCVHFQNNAILSTNEQEVQINGLGTTQSGYIYCRRLKSCWFFCELYIPT